MKYPIGVQDDRTRQWMDESAKEFNLTRWEPIIGTDGATWDVATKADAANLETFTFHLTQPGARVTFEMVATPDVGTLTPTGGAGGNVGFEFLVDSEVAGATNSAFLAVYTANAVECPISYLRVLDLAPGKHTVTINARKKTMTAGTMYYRYRIDAFYRTINVPKV